MQVGTLLVSASLLVAQPVRTVWIHGPKSNPAVATIRPDVHSVETTESEVIVRSAGLSLAYLGPLAADPNPDTAARRFTFSIPLTPEPEMERHAHIPARFAGVFVNGVPIYNRFESASYRGQNLWHYDGIKRNLKSNHTAPPPGLLEALIPDRGHPSPIIGYALDGYPVYGPWSATGRMRSSYQLRRITTRDHLPDGTLLSPEQGGPPVNSKYPMGTFAEDYEYVPDAGDLDQFNGRFSQTPEYPMGTYAYFLSTDEYGGLAFPYLPAFEFYGRYHPAAPLLKSAQSGAVSFQYDPAGKLRFQIVNAAGIPLRHLEFVHERPLHVLIVSHDLASFAHVHPEADEQGVWEVSHSFPGSGRYRVYIDFTPPGGHRRIEFFDVDAPGPAHAQVAAANPGIELANALTLRAGEDVELQFHTTKAMPKWRPYLGAWAHVIIAGEGLGSFLHAHPVD